MDALAAEIAKKRKQVDGAKGGDAKRRWVRTADLQQQRRKDIEASAARKPMSVASATPSCMCAARRAS